MKRIGKIILAAALAALSPSPLFACAACYGQSSDPLAHGMNWGIFTLLGIVALMLTSVASFFFLLSRRAAAAREKEAADEQLSGVEA